MYEHIQFTILLNTKCRWRLLHNNIFLLFILMRSWRFTKKKNLKILVFKSILNFFFVDLLTNRNTCKFPHHHLKIPSSIFWKFIFWILSHCNRQRSASAVRWDKGGEQTIYVSHLSKNEILIYSEWSSLLLSILSYYTFYTKFACSHRGFQSLR